MIPTVGSSAIPAAQPARSSTTGAENRPAQSTPEGQPLELTDEQRALQALQEATESQNESNSSGGVELTEEEERIVRELRQTDAEVRAHEQAHIAAGGGYTGPARYETVTGPDGREYAISGEVDIDTSPIPDNPAATIRKMDIVIRAALAPAEPSPQDYAVARAAQQVRAQAQRELNEQRQAEQEEASQGPNSTKSELQAQIDALIQGLNTSESLTETTRGGLFDAIN